MEQKRYHLIGIGGIGMSGLARILLQRGQSVSGSDVKASSFTKLLQELGAEVFIGHQASHVPERAVVVYSTDIKDSNPEYQEAKSRGLFLLHRSQLLQELMGESRALLVAGAHGKTTTSALLAHTLVQAGLNPSYCIGGMVPSLKAQAGHGDSKLFVAEADESDGSFLTYKPAGMIITNIDQDHMNYWKTEENLIAGFVDFFHLASRKDLCFWCADNEILSSLNLGGVSYGFSPKAELRITKAEYLGWKSRFSFEWKEKTYVDIEIPLIGVHNVLNAAAVCGLCLQLGVDGRSFSSLFASFQGVGRRAEKKGEAGQVVFYDDYAHHPTEIHTTLAALKQAAGDRRLFVLFQPHRFTRVSDCFDQFAASLMPADKILMTDVHGSGEEPIEGVSSQALLKKMIEQGLHTCVYIPKEELVKTALAQLEPGDICVSMGAGDITYLGQQVLQELEASTALSLR